MFDIKLPTPLKKQSSYSHTIRQTTTEAASVKKNSREKSHERFW